MTTSQMWEAIEPGSPILLLAALVGLNRVLNVHSDVGALVVGLALGTVMMLAVVWFSRKQLAPGVRPLMHRRLLPWGVAFGVLGGSMLFLDEPWKYWGAAVLTNAVLYLVFGSLAYLRHSRAAS